MRLPLLRSIPPVPHSRHLSRVGKWLLDVLVLALAIFVAVALLRWFHLIDVNEIRAIAQ